MRSVLLLFVVVALPGFAADKKKPVIKTTKTVQVGGAPKRTNTSVFATGFNALDKNGDGYLTRMEYGYNRESSKAAAEFDRMDANKDGRVSRSEYK